MENERKLHLMSRMPTSEWDSLSQGIDDAPFMNHKCCHNVLVSVKCQHWPLFKNLKEQWGNSGTVSPVPLGEKL